MDDAGCDGDVGQSILHFDLAHIRALQAAGLAGQRAENVARADPVLAATRDEDGLHVRAAAQRVEQRRECGRVQRVARQDADRRARQLFGRRNARITRARRE